jgi:hypothetical protein
VLKAVTDDRIDRFNRNPKCSTVQTGRSAQNAGLLFHMTVETSALLPSLLSNDRSLLWTPLSLLPVRLSLFRAEFYAVIE